MAASPTGAWSGQAGKIAAYQDSAWVFYTPREGWLAWVADEDTIYSYDGSGWGAKVAIWGINATPTPPTASPCAAPARRRGQPSVALGRLLSQGVRRAVDAVRPRSAAGRGRDRVRRPARRLRRADPAMQARIDGLVAEHSIFHSRGQLGHTDYTEAERAVLPAAHHRLVRVHPGSKRKTLYMGSHASHIVGWPMPDGRLLLRDLMEHATQREFVHSHSWRVGDLVIWDNRCTLHRGRSYDDVAHPRDLRRVTTRDPKSALGQVA